MRFIPHQYQETGIDFIQTRKRAGLFWDMGLGKTGTIYETIRRTPAMLPALVVAPLRCVFEVWPQENAKFNFGFRTQIIHNKDKQVMFDQLRSGADIKITNYESLGRIKEWCEKHKRVPFRSMILDESTKVKSKESQRFDNAQAIAKHCPYVVLLTGTPVPAGYKDLWSQIYMLDRGETFGEYDRFIGRHFSEDNFGRPKIKTGHHKIIERRIQPFILRGDAKELLDMPPLCESTTRLTLPLTAVPRYEEVEEGFINGYDDLKEHTVAPYAPMRCCASGFVYHNQDDGSREVELIHQSKLDAVRETIDGIGSKPVMLVYNFQGERGMITNEFECPYIDGSVSNKRTSEIVKQWNRGELPLLAVQCQSVGHGLNLQSGGRHMIWYSLPDSGETYQQTVARLYRQGQNGAVFIYRFVTGGTIEEHIEDLLEQKILTSENLLASILRRLSR